MSSTGAAMATMRSRPRFDTTALNTQMAMTNTGYETLPRQSLEKYAAAELVSATAVVTHARPTTMPKRIMPVLPMSASTMAMTSWARPISLVYCAETVAPRYASPM